MTVHWSPRAKRELNRIRRWIAKQNPSAAERVVSQILHSIRRLEQFPNIGQATDRGSMRLLQVTGLSYALSYRVTGEEIEILAVFDQRRNPEELF